MYELFKHSKMFNKLNKYDFKVLIEYCEAYTYLSETYLQRNSFVLVLYWV